MNKLRSPVIALMTRLIRAKKFMVLGLICLVAVAMVVCSLYMSLNQVDRASQGNWKALH